MEVSEAIQKRATIRRWKTAPVEKEKILKVLEAGRRAPSWGNVQPWRFIVIQDKKKIEELAEAGAPGQPHIVTAPVVIVCCGVAEAFSRKMHRESLKQLIEAGVMDWPDELLDNVLGSDLFAPYRLGEQVMMIKASEQIMISIAYMTLEAVNQGLGSCWAGAISHGDIRKALNLPANLFVHDFLLLGYPDEDPKPRPRKALNEIVFWEKYEA